MKDFNFTVKAGSGKYSNLDREYDKFVKKTIADIDNENKLFRWETYNLIMDELLKDGMVNLFDEIKYRLTDGEDPNDVMIDVLKNVTNSNGFLWLMKKRVVEYKEEDFYNRFYD
jgi:hypothetical protein